jgi:hypothetical protein
MTKIDYVLIAVFAWSLITGIVMRMWCHSHLRATHPAEFDVIEYSDNQNWMHLLDYPLSECRQNSLTHFLYRTCLRGSTCQDCIWISWIVAGSDLALLTTTIVLLILFNLT